MKRSSARFLEVLALLASVVASMCLSYTSAAGAEGPVNHPPGFVKPEPDAVIPLWPDGVPNLVSGGKAEAFVNERYANVSVPQLFVYLPPKEKASGTALVICAGGGYGHLAMCLHVENVVQLLNDRGIAVFGLKYRTRYANNDVVEDALADGQRAVRIVRSRAQEWGLDPHRIGVQGYSAGGNLCLNLAGRFDAGDPQAADPIERFSCRPDFCVLMCPWPNQRSIDKFPLSQERRRRSSPMRGTTRRRRSALPWPSTTSSRAWASRSSCSWWTRAATVRSTTAWSTAPARGGRRRCSRG